VNTVLKLCLVYIIFITWNKAGHAEGITTVFLNVLAALILVLHFFQKKFWEIKLLLPYIPIVALTIISIVSFLNPRYRVISVKDITDLNFEKVMLQSNDPNKIEMMTKGMNLILDSAQTSPSNSIALYFYFKNTYIDKYGSDKSDIILNFLNKLHDRIELPFHSFLPTSAIRDAGSFGNYYLFYMSLLIGIIIFQNIRRIEQIENIILLFSFNFIALCLVGLYQKYTQLWTDDYVEILGIWNAPEPRYYFSTFTYKNHWSAYALMMIFCLIFLVNRLFSKIEFNHLKSKILVCTIFAIIIGSSTIFFSGSRSGTILLVFSGFSLAFLILKKKFYNKYKLILYSIFFLPVIAFVTFLFLDNEEWKEMRTTSKIQIQNLIQGNAPLRWHFWNDTIEMIEERPLWGHGYQSFSSLYPKFQSQEVRYERSLGLKNAHQYYVPLVAHAHNDLLEFTAEWGLVGMFAIFLPFVVYLIVESYSSPSISFQFLSFGCIVFMAYCLIDFPTRTPACLTNFCAFLAISQKYGILLRRTQIRK